MHIMSNTCLLICLVPVCLFLQGVNTANCDVSRVQSCTTNYAPAAISVDQDITKLCSAVHSYLNCLEKYVADCVQDLSRNSYVSSLITAARQELSKAGCGNGASGPVYSIIAIAVGVCLHRLF